VLSIGGSRVRRSRRARAEARGRQDFLSERAPPRPGPSSELSDLAVLGGLLSVLFVVLGIPAAFFLWHVVGAEALGRLLLGVAGVLGGGLALGLWGRGLIRLAEEVARRARCLLGAGEGPRLPPRWPALVGPPMALHLAGLLGWLPVLGSAVLGGLAWILGRIPDPQATRDRLDSRVERLRRLGRALTGLGEVATAWLWLGLLPETARLAVGLQAGVSLEAGVLGTCLLLGFPMALPRRHLARLAPAVDAAPEDPLEPGALRFLSPQEPVEGECPYCGERLERGALTLCPVCETPHHQDCWREARSCTTYGCVGRGP